MPDDVPTVPGILRRQARSRGEHPLLICDGERISYAEAEGIKVGMPTEVQAHLEPLIVP